MYKTLHTNSSKYFYETFPDFFRKVKPYENPDVIFDTYDPTIKKHKYKEQAENTIFILNIDTKHGSRKNIRTGPRVDQHYLADTSFSKPLFAKSFDMYAPNLINSPIMHTRADLLSVDFDYFKTLSSQPIKFFNRCYWRGGPSHKDRKQVLKFLGSKKDSRIDVAMWRPKKASSIYRQRPGGFDSSEYTNYFRALETSDIGLCIRGDRPWLHSFLDVLRAGAVPVCINTQYHNLGWHHIGYDFKKDLFLSYDLEKDTLEDVYTGICSLLEDKDRLFEMKHNIRKFYKDWYLSDRSHFVDKPKKVRPRYVGWGDFIAAKAVEIIKNNFVLNDNFLMCPTVLDIKKSNYA